MKFLPIATLAAMTLVAIDGACAQEVATASNATGMAAPPHRWSGYYEEAFIGGHIASAHENFPNFGTGTGNFSVSGATGGLGAGYNWQFGRFLIGAEGDIAANSSEGAAHAPNAAYNYEMENNWLATVKGRVGYDIGGVVLPYLTAGLAVGDVRVHNYRPDGRGTENDFTNTNIGWVAGAGVEAPLSNTRWGLKFEYEHVDLGTVEGNGTRGNTINGSFSDNIVRLYLIHRSR